MKKDTFIHHPCPECLRLGWNKPLDKELTWKNERTYVCKYSHYHTHSFMENLIKTGQAMLKQYRSGKMPKVSEVYKGSKYMNALDIQKLPKTLTITAIEQTIVNEEEGTEKLVATFKEAEKQLVLNSTNAKTIAESLGDETDDWVGAKIQLVKVKATFNDKLVDAIRIGNVSKK